LSAVTETWSQLQDGLGYVFRDRSLLERSLTHKSFSNEHRELAAPSNERLEFLGDTVLGFCVGELIFHAFPELQEGALSKIKAHLVSTTTLAAKGRALGIGRFLRMGTGEARSGGGDKLSLVADAFEAIVAAVYLDGGLPAASRLVKHLFGPDVAGINVGDLSFHDYKTALQEAAQGLGLSLPEYRVVDEYGPDHEKSFVVEVFWNGQPFAYGRGPSKREAQRKGAKEALRKLGRLPQ
jgi:ribonuclease-3